TAGRSPTPDRRPAIASSYRRRQEGTARRSPYCFAHARRKFDELFKANASAVAAEAIQRIAWLYRIEADARELPSQERLQMRQERSKPLWNALHLWLKVERTRVPEGSAI